MGKKKNALFVTDILDVVFGKPTLDAIPFGTDTHCVYLHTRLIICEAKQPMIKVRCSLFSYWYFCFCRFVRWLEYAAVVQYR
jgi:hypothetical protein